MQNGGDSPEVDSIHGERNRAEKYVPFDIENGSETDVSLSNIGVGGPGSFGNGNTLPPKSKTKSVVSAADVLKTLFLILMWYTFSTFLTLYNKTLLGDDMGKFPAPLLMNTVHFSMQAILSKAIIWFWSHRWTLPFTVVPTGLATALDVNLSNESLVFISVTFATMCKSASPIFLLVFAFAFRLESPSIKLLGIIIIISIGVLFSVAKETEFEFWGFLFVMLAAVMSGFRWCMTQILLQVLTEFVLVSVTSAVTVQIAGVVKEAVTILVAVFYFHDEFTWLKGFGLFTILVGVSLFNWYKFANILVVSFNLICERYQKLQAGHANEDGMLGSRETNASAKYVILEEIDDLDEGT
ncbi:putative sugar phosphate/phosphate translocator [Citrus sinensis]|uniref:Sugar phosphate/phosphate translocator n=1 Tax=Citrus sinensis TaxID=2711 RepID=A0ACB8N8A6_CITSI|nr:putative sugar phosphate/phosphate translocator [Citrus sinensis]